MKAVHKDINPNKAFRMDWPGSGGTTAQRARRHDFREVAEWDNGGGWCVISNAAEGEWHANITEVLPDGRKGGTNNHAPGLPAENIPNARPVADAGPDQSVASSAAVTLDGSGSSDADNDSLTYKWTQTAGQQVTLSDDTAQKPTFTAPAGPATLTFELKVKDITEALHHHNPGNAESFPDSVTITVSP